MSIREATPPFCAVLWHDKPKQVIATVGRSPRQLAKWQRQGLPMYTRGSGTGKRQFWLTLEVIAFLKATATVTPPAGAER